MSKAKKASHTPLQGLSDPLAARLIASCTDVAFVVDRKGVIQEVSLGQSVDPDPAWEALVGQRWVDTLMRDSRGKVEKLLREAVAEEQPRARELNQLVDGVGEVPLRFTGTALDDDRVIMLGRDLRPLADLQQRMVTAQQAMEVEYGRLRQADTRYRVLFHVSAEGVLIVKNDDHKILESNPAAATLLGMPAGDLRGRVIEDLFDEASRAGLAGLIAAVEAGAQTDATVLTGESANEAPGRELRASASLFRQAGSALLLIRLTSAEQHTGDVARASRMLAALESMPDGFVVTDEESRVLCVNGGFCELVQRANERQIVGQRLDRWLGRPGVDLNIIQASLKEHGVIRNFATIIRGDFGEPQEAVVTAVSALDGHVPCLGFSIRAVSSRLESMPSSTLLPRSIEQLRDLVGRVSLKEIVKESTDLIERMCIEAALDVSGNNRAAAAQLLGLSRQGLYSKLRRHGLGEFQGG